MPGRRIRLVSIWGIPVGISPWWLLIVALITVSLGASYFPEAVSGIAPAPAYLLGFLSALLLFASILAHEFGHAIVARRHGVEIEEIDLWLLGGVSILRGEAHAPGDELRYALAGPAVTAVVCVVFGALAAALPASTPEVVTALVDYQLLVNAAILVFNLLPAFPLDGGRVLRSLLWRRGHDLRRATAVASSVGRAFGYVLIALGLTSLFVGAPSGLWLALIGFFLVAAAGAQARNAEAQAALSGVRAAELMSAPAIAIPSDASAEYAGSAYFRPYRYTSFPVVDPEGRVLGLVTMERIERLPPHQRASHSVAEVAYRDPELLVAEGEDAAELLQRVAFARVGRAVVVDRSAHPLGVVSITDVERALRAARLATAPAGGAR